MITSRGNDGQEIRHGVAFELRAFSGAVAARVVERRDVAVPEHSHDWPVLSLHVTGRCWRRFQDVDAEIDGPSAVLHPTCEAHSSAVGSRGLEQIDLMFDPAWLGFGANNNKLSGVRCWLGGPIGAAASALARRWTDESNGERELISATREFLELALNSQNRNIPHWLPTLRERMNADGRWTASSLAKHVSLHPTWLAHAYRAATGEGLSRTLQRTRVEIASEMLRDGDEPAALIATEVGFCDQSHMIRCFKRILGRTPEQIRAEARFWGN